MNHPDLETDKFKNCEEKIYTSIKALSHASGINARYYKMAKKKNAAGFCANNTVNFKLLKPEFIKIYESLLQDEPEDIQYFKKEIAKRDVTLKDLQIKKLESNMVEPEAVKSLFIEIATLQSIVLNKSFSELPPRISGRSEQECKKILDSTLQEIISVIQEKIDKWSKEYE